MKNIVITAFASLAMLFSVSCEKPSDPVLNEGLKITPSAKYFVADGVDKVTLTLTNVAGVDVSAKAKFYISKDSGSEAIQGNEFSTKTPAVYTFFAVLEGEITGKVSVTAASVIPKLPVDAVPSKFDGFYRRVHALQGTGAWCGNCPYLSKVIHDYAGSELADRVVFVAMHNGDGIASFYSESVLNAFGVKSFPALYMQLSNSKSYYGSTVPMIEEFVKSIIKVDPISSISVATAINGDRISVNVGVKVGKKANLRIGVNLIEDGVFLKQNNTTPVQGDFVDNHANVVRAGIPVDPMFEPLGGVLEQTKETVYQYFCEFDMKAAGVLKKENTRVVIFIYDANTASCDNVVSVVAGKEVAYQYK